MKITNLSARDIKGKTFRKQRKNAISKSASGEKAGMTMQLDGMDRNLNKSEFERPLGECHRQPS